MARGSSSNESAVITVTLQGDSRGLDNVFNLSQKSAENLSKAMSTAFETSPNKAIQNLGLIEAERKKIQDNFTNMKAKIEESFNFNLGSSVTNLRTIATELGAIETKALSVASSLRAIATELSTINNVSKSTASSTSVTRSGGKSTPESRIVAAEASFVSPTIGERPDSILSNTASIVKSNNEIAKSNQVRADSFTHLLNFQKQVDKNDAENIAKNVKFLEGQLQKIRSIKETTAANKSYTESLIQMSKVDIDAASNSRFSANARERQFKRQELGIGEYKVTPEQQSNINSRNRAAAIGGAIGATGGRVANFGSDLVDSAKNTAQKAADGFKERFKQIEKTVSDVGETSKSNFARIFSANFFAGLAYNAVGSLFSALERVTIQTVTYAARTEELGVAVQSLARVNGISTETITEQEVAIKRLNITTQDARETLSRFINVGFDVKDAGPLARVAQDLAVIQGYSSSEELNKLTVGIQTLQSRNLRTAGVYITVDEVLNKLSATTGRARDSFSTLEKQQAVLNAVFDYGAKVSGTYDAAMQTVSKQARSLERQFYEAQNSIGENFIPTMGIVVSSTSAVLDIMTRFPGIFTRAATGIGLVVTALIALRTNAIQNAVVGVGNGLISGIDVVKGFLGYETQQQKKNANLSAELSIKRQILELDSLDLDVKLKAIPVEERALGTDYARLQIKKKQLLSDIEDNKVQASNVGKAPGSGFAGAIGKLTTVLAIATAVFEVAKTISEVANAPYAITNIDLSAAKKNANDLENTKTYAEDLKKLSDGTFGNQQSSNQRILEIYNSFDVVLKSRIDKEVGINNLLVDRKKSAEQETLYLQAQVDILEKNKQAKIEEGKLNFEFATKNLDSKSKEVSVLQEALLAASDAKTKLEDPKIKKGYVDPQDSFYDRAGSYAIGTVANLWSNELYAKTTKGFSLEAQADSVNYLTKINNEAGLSLSEVRAKVDSTARDFEKLYDTYGKTDTLDEFIAKNYAISESFKTGGEAVTEIDFKVQRLKETLQTLHLGDVKKSVDFTLGGADGALNTLGESFLKQRTQYLKDANTSIDGRKGLTTEQIAAAKAKSIRVFDSGLATDKETQTFTTDLKRTLTDEAILNGGGQTVDQIVQRIQAIRAEKEAIGANYEERVASNSFRNEEEKTVAKGAFGFTKLYDAMVLQAEAARTATKVNEAVELSLYGMSKALYDATNAYDDFNSRPSSLRADDIKAELVDKTTNLKKSYQSKAGALGVPTEDITKVLDVATNTPDFNNERKFLEFELKKVDARTKIKEIDENLADLADSELSKYNRQLAVKQAFSDAITKQKNIQTEITLLGNRELQALIRKTEVQQGVLDFKKKEVSIETEIAILKKTSILPAISAQLIGEKAVLQSIQDRKQAEQQLTADIAVEIAKRSKYGVDANNLVAQTFLDLQKEDLNTQTDAIKSGLKYQASQGDTSAFKDNPLVRQAITQSEHLKKVQDKVDIQIDTIKSGNDIAKASQDILSGVGDKVDKNSADIVTAIKGINIPQQGSSYTQSDLHDLSTTSSVRRYDPTTGTYFNISDSSSTSSSSSSSVSDKEKGRLITQTARAIGMSPATLAGIIQFESSGVASKTNSGGYAGLIQFSPSLQKKYGVSKDTSFADQQQYIIRYFRERGFKAGMSDLQAYATVLGGNPYADINKTDSNGTSPLSGINAQRARSRSVVKKYGLDSSYINDVISDVKNSPPPTPQTSIDDIVQSTGLKLSQIFKILGLSAGDNLSVGKLVQKRTLTDKNSSDLLSGKTINDVFKTLDTGFDQTTSLKAAGAYTSDRTKANEDIKAQQAARVIETAQVKTLQKEYADLADEKYKSESQHENLLGASERDKQIEILKKRAASLESKTGADYTKTKGEAEVAKQREYNNLLAEGIKLEVEQNFREQQHDEYLKRVGLKFGQDQINLTHQIQDAETVLSIKRTEFAKADSTYNKLRIAQELQTRDEARQAVAEQIDAEKRYQATYQGTALQLADFDKQLELERLKSRTETLDEITKLEIKTAHIQEGLQDRLRLKQKQLDNARAGELEANLAKQVELEEAYKRKSDPYDPVLARNNALDKITSNTKTQTDIINGLWNDSFDAISGGFGKVVDKMSSKLGIFGSAIGNLLKSLGNNILGNIFKGVADQVFPKDPRVSDAQKDKGGVGAISGGSLIDLVTGGGFAGIHGESSTRGGGLPVGGLDIASASQTAAASIYQLGVAASSVAQAMVGIAGTSAGTVADMGGIISSLSFGVGKKGGASAGISKGIGGFLGGTSSSASSSIGSIASAGIHEIGNIGDSIHPILPSQTVSGGQGGLGTQAGSILPGIIGVGAPNGHPSLGIGGILGTLSKGLGLKGIGKSLLSASPTIGASLGGLLGGQSATGNILGTIGGGIAGTIGSLVGTSLLAGTGLFGGTAGIGAIAGVLGISGAATLGIGLAVAGAFLLVSYLFGHSKKVKAEKNNVTKWSSDAVQKMKDLLKGVQSDKIDGADAVTQASSIIADFQTQLGTIKTKEGKALGQQQLGQLVDLQQQIQKASDAQAVRKETDSRIAPTYATGGVSSTEVIRVSRGETLYSPATVPYLKNAFTSARIPGFAGSTTIVPMPERPVVKIPGHFDGKDDIYMRVPTGTVIATPEQNRVIETAGYATGGVAGQISAPAAHAVISQPPTYVIAIGDEEAERLGRMIPGAIIVGKTSKHIRDTGKNGLLGEIAYNLSKY